MGFCKRLIPSDITELLLTPDWQSDEFEFMPGTLTASLSADIDGCDKSRKDISNSVTKLATRFKCNSYSCELSANDLSTEVQNQRCIKVLTIKISSAGGKNNNSKACHVIEDFNLMLDNLVGEVTPQLSDWKSLNPILLTPISN